MAQIPHMAQAARDALVGKDVGVAASLDDTSLLHLAGTSGLAGDYQGQDAILGLLERMMHLTDGTLHYSRSRVLVAVEEVIVVCGRSSASRGGTHLDAEAVRVLSLRGDTVRDIWVFHQNQDQVDSFWTGSG